MGSIMSIGVAVANAILLVTSAESIRKQKEMVEDIGSAAAKNRIRPILMTTFAMIAGMIPMAVGLGEGSHQTSPLGIAVIGGLLLSSVTNLLILPQLYNVVMGNKKYSSASLDPDDVASKYYQR